MKEPQRAVVMALPSANVVLLLRRYGRGHGIQARIARELGVSEATISRDVASVWALVEACLWCGGR